MPTQLPNRVNCRTRPQIREVQQGFAYLLGAPLYDVGACEPRRRSLPKWQVQTPCFVKVMDCRSWGCSVGVGVVEVEVGEGTEGVVHGGDSLGCISLGGSS